VRVVKKKLAPPFMEAEFDVIYGEGISRVGDLIDAAAEQGIIEKSGAWYSFGGERIGQGRENVKRFLADHPDIYETIYGKTREALGLGAKGKDAQGEE
jgi:recombination protein RecA